MATRSSWPGLSSWWIISINISAVNHIGSFFKAFLIGSILFIICSLNNFASQFSHIFVEPQCPKSLTFFTSQGERGRGGVTVMKLVPPSSGLEYRYICTSAWSICVIHASSCWTLFACIYCKHINKLVSRCEYLNKYIN